MVEGIVSNERDEPTSCLVQHIAGHCCEVLYFGSVCFMSELSFLICNAICMCVVNKEFELIEFVFDSVYVDQQYNEIYLTYTDRCVSLSCVCSHMVDVSFPSFPPFPSFPSSPPPFPSFPSCCCLPTPISLASGRSPLFPLVVHQPASPSSWSVV